MCTIFPQGNARLTACFFGDQTKYIKAWFGGFHLSAIFSKHCIFGLLFLLQNFLREKYKFYKNLQRATGIVDFCEIKIRENELRSCLKDDKISWEKTVFCSMKLMSKIRIFVSYSYLINRVKCLFTQYITFGRNFITFASFVAVISCTFILL